MPNKNIVILDANTLGDDLDLDVFKKLGHVANYGFTSPSQVAQRIKDAHIIITNKVNLNEGNLSKAPKLELICLTATGTNNVDKIYCNNRNIIVSNVVAYSTNSVAQHTFALLFYLYEKLAYYDNYVKSGTYCGDEVFTHFERKFHELTNKTWGIIGMGNIGQKVALIASSFGANVIYYSTSGRNKDQAYPQVDFESLLRQSDIISIHAPLNHQTDNLLDYSDLCKMKSDAILLNLGRGRIVNEAGLAKALVKNRIGAAALDVLEHEPIRADNPLLRIQDSTKLLITPHIAWASKEARLKVISEVYANIESFMKGHPRNQVSS